MAVNNNELQFEERTIRVNRVSKVVKGGRRFSFAALMVVGDGNGCVGYGLGKANEVPEAIRKGVQQAKKNLIRVPIVAGQTIPFEILGSFGAGKVLMMPASPGTGVIAGGAARAVFESAGLHNILAKCLGSNNPHNVVKAAFAGLSRLKTAEELMARRGLTE